MRVLTQPDPYLNDYINSKIEECAFSILDAYRIQDEAKVLTVLQKIQAWLDLKASEFG